MQERALVSVSADTQFQNLIGIEEAVDLHVCNCVHVKKKKRKDPKVRHRKKTEKEKEKRKANLNKKSSGHK